MAHMYAETLPVAPPSLWIGSAHSRSIVHRGCSPRAGSIRREELSADPSSTARH